MKPAMPEDPQFRQRAEAIERLTQRVQAIPDPQARTAAIELVTAVMDLHADCLQEMLSIVYDSPDGAALLNRVAEQPLARGLLLLYGLHPDSPEQRIARSLDKIRPYLQSRGSDVELIEVVDAKVRVRLAESRNGCGSSMAALQQAVEQAIYDAAPEVTQVIAEPVPARVMASQLVQLK